MTCVDSTHVYIELDDHLAAVGAGFAPEAALLLQVLGQVGARNALLAPRVGALDGRLGAFGQMRLARTIL